MIKTNANVPLLQLLKVFFVSSRPVSWINTVYPFIAGYLASGGRITAYFVVAACYFLLPYNALVYVVNDVFDYESDKRNPRKGGIEGGLLPPILHRIMLALTTAINLPFLIYLLAFGTGAANSVLCCIVIGALTYSLPLLRFKERPFIDSVNSSLHFVSPLLFAVLLTGWEMRYIPYLLSFFFWGVASHAFGAVQDIQSDKQAGIGSIATFLGARLTVYFSGLFYTAAIVTLALQGVHTFAVALAGLLYLLMIIPYRNITNENAESANGGWKYFLKINQVTGFVITMQLILARYF